MFIEKGEEKMGIVILFFIVMLYICQDWLGFSLLTTIFMSLSIISIILSYIEIKGNKEAKKIKKAKKYTVTVISKEVVHGYRGRTTYTFELKIENQNIQIRKDNIHRDLEVNQTVDVYPVYDEQKNVIDFDFVDTVEKNTKIYKPFIIFAIGTTFTSVLFILNDQASFMSVTSTIIGTSFFLILFLSTGIYSLRRVLIDKNTLIPVKAVIHSLRITSRLTDTGVLIDYITPIYRLEVNGQIYQFLGDKNATEKDRGKEVIVYYDKNTMEFFDNPKGNSDMFLSVAMFILAILLLYSFVKDVL